MSTTLQMERKPAAAALAERTIVFQMQFSRPGFKRKVDSGSVVEDADETMVHITKDLIDRAALGRIRSAERAHKSWLRARALPCSTLRDTMFLVPISLVDEIDKRHERFVRERETLVDSFVKNDYEGYIADAKVRLGPKHFKQQEYPTGDEVRGAFGVYARFLALEVPTNLQQINPDLWRRENYRLERELRQTADEIQDGMRVAMSDLVSTLVDKMTPGPDGKKKVLLDSHIEKLTNFIDLFADKNVRDDSELEALVGTAKALISGRSPEEIRKLRYVRDNFRSGMEKIKEQLDTMIVTGKRRAFDFDDEE